MTEQSDEFMIIPDDQQFVLPELVDDEFAVALMQRGKSSREALIVRLILWMLAGSAIGFVSTLIGLNLMPLLMIGVFIATVSGFVLTSSIEKAMLARREDEATRLLPKAIYWTALFSPFTQFSLVRLVQLQLNLIMLEGRYTELEMLSLFSAGYTERSARPLGVPKNWAVANNLAIAHMQQGRYAQGAKLFSAALEKVKTKQQQLVLIQNLSYCQIRLNEISAAAENNKQALLLSGGEHKTLVGGLILANEAVIKAKQGSFDEAETLIGNLKKQLSKKQMTPQMVIILERTMAEIRYAQKRFDEAKLFYDNTLDILLSGDNPNYLDIAHIEREYAKCLEESGDVDGAAKAMSRASECFNFYLQRELETVNLVKARLAAGKTVRYGTQLLDLAHRVRYIPSIEFQRGFNGSE